jgi:hypothetical protein
VKPPQPRWLAFWLSTAAAAAIVLTADLTIWVGGHVRISDSGGPWIASAIGLSTLLLGFAVWNATGLQLRPSLDRQPRLTIEDHLRTVMRSLQDASNVIVTVERELRARQARLDRLSAQYSQVERLASVNREAADAIRSELMQLVRAEGRRSFWLGIFVTAVVSVPVGILTGIVAILLMQRFGSH